MKEATLTHVILAYDPFYDSTLRVYKISILQLKVCYNWRGKVQSIGHAKMIVIQLA